MSDHAAPPVVPPSADSPGSGPASSLPATRACHLLDTASTDAQTATEEECAPFFVDLTTLSAGQLDHLRHVGLLPPLPADVDSGRANGGLDGKAARLLGVEDDGPRIELLEETGDGSPRDGNNHASSGNNGGDGDAKPFDPYAIRLLRSAHTSYLTNALCIPLKRGFVSLDASHPWMVYWCLHSLDLLGYFDTDERDANSGGLGDNTLRDVEVLQKAHLLERVVSTLRHCWTDVPLEFAASEIEQDARLKQLYDEQQNGEAAETNGEEVSIVGGGYGGGPQQMPHCAPIYAAVLSLCIVAGLGVGGATDHPYRKAGRLAMEELTRRRLQLYAFFLTLREPEGDGNEKRTAFRMQHDGEIDVRASYCLLAPCHLLGLLEDKDSNPLRCPSIARSIASCQTFEGGFGAEPFNEAHGGYTFCALAALRILDAVSMIDVDALSSWLARRQMGFEGGFCGRTNKLVDGCYSFWQGGAVAVLDGWLSDAQNEDPLDGSASEPSKKLSFDEIMLQRYILLCAQDVNGGLRDKPSKPKDFYHSCYNLSGLSVAQHAVRPWPPSTCNTPTGSEAEELNRIFGDAGVNIVGRTDPVVNIRIERMQFMLSHRF